MKYFILLTFILFATLKSFNCDCGKFKAQRSFDVNKAIGKWFVVQRYANGLEEYNSICQYGTFYPNLTAIKTIVYNHKPKAIVIENVLKIVNGTGEIILSVIPPTNPNHYFVVFSDYYNLLVIRTCYKNEGLLVYIVSKNVIIFFSQNFCTYAQERSILPEKLKY